MKTYVKKGGFFTSWITSKSLEKPFNADPLELKLPSYHIGFTDWRELYNEYKVSQIKKQFLDEGSFFKSSYPVDVVYSSISFGDDSNMVDFSGFWYYPTEITVYSKLIIDSDKEKILPLRVFCNGSVIGWVNKEESFRILSSSLNKDTVKDVCIKLKKGENELIIGLNELGERNTMVRFALQNLSEERIVTSINSLIKEEDLAAINGFIDSLDMEKRGDYLVFSSIPLTLPLLVVVVDENNNKETINLKEGESEFRIKDVFDTHILITNVIYLDAQFRKGFYRFKREEPVLNIPETEKERKAHYIDDLINKNKPSPALFIAGLTRGLNLYNICQRPIENSIERIIKRADCSDFRLTEIIWMYCLGKDILPSSLLAQFKECMIGYRYWFTEKGNDVMWFFSENHALALHACEYIAGRLFPDEIFTNSGMSGRAHMEHALILIREWFSFILKYGYTEYCSVNYLPVDMLGYMTLMKFSYNSEINDLCRKAMDMTMNFFALQCHNGVLVGANGRTYINDLLSPSDIQANAFCYFAWGTKYAPYGYKPTLYALLDEYECPKELKEKALLKKDEIIEEHFTQGYRQNKITIVKTKDYFIGSASSLLEGKEGDQEHLFDAVVGDEDGRFWINHPGEARILGTRRPGYFTGNAYTPCVSQYKSSAVISYSFPDIAEVNFTHLICFRENFDKEILEKNSLYLRRGNVNVYIHVDNGFEIPSVKSLQKYELRSLGLKNKWYVRIDDSMEFEEFIKAMKCSTFTELGDILYVQDPIYGSIQYRLLKEGF